MSFQALLARGFVFLDGAMGTMLQKKGLEAGELPELLSLSHPEIIEEIHSDYIAAGAQIIYTNTFGANRHKLAGSGHSVREVAAASIGVARRAAERAAGERPLIAFDIGPIGRMLAPAGDLPFEEAYDIFREQAEASEGADLIVIETMTDLGEMRAALLAATEHGGGKPVICTMSFEENGRTFTGSAAESMAITLSGLGAAAVGVNCSLGPAQLAETIRKVAEYTDLPVIAKPNAGLPDPVSGGYDVDPEEFAEQVAALVPLGVRIFGGCCGTSPEYIAAVRKRLATERPVERERVAGAVVCSSTEVVPIDRPRIIGERINPTGKKAVQRALERGDSDFFLKLAVEQAQAGAELLDVNVGHPGIDEAATMRELVTALQGITSLALQIDSSDPAAIEAALRVYHGKAVVNSVNGEEGSLARILPTVRRYGAAVVGLTLDAGGIPETVEGRVAIARRILERAEALGIPKEDVYIDCLTMTVSTEQEAASVTLEALRRVKEELGLKTVLGVSNVSFGLPGRGLINSTFLTMALANGLDLPILNPSSQAMTGAVRAYRLLANIDRHAREFIEAYQGAPAFRTLPPVDTDIAFAIERGLAAEAAEAARVLLETEEPLAVVNDRLIPALDRAGSRFEAGEIFIPQLVLSAEAAKAAFQVVRERLAKDDSAPEERGTIILATVKGDIHDIGKNIVKVLLENYGFTVIDLGRDVESHAICDEALRRGVKLVGLSALMTTTLGAMKETISLLRHQNVPCKVMVGGAVLTPEYAAAIGADFYAKDAKESVDIARKVFG